MAEGEDGALSSFSRRDTGLTQAPGKLELGKRGRTGQDLTFPF